jgi:hypothetical protein
MSGYLTRLLAGAIHPQRTVRPLVAPLFGPPSAGPEWLLRASRPSRAAGETGGIDAGHIVDGAAGGEDSPDVMPAPSPPRFVAASPTPVGVDPALRDPRIPARPLRGDGRSAGTTARDAARAPATGPHPTGAAADEDVFGRRPGLGHPGNEMREAAREHERLQPRVREHAAPRDPTREHAAAGDGAVAPLLDRWRARRMSTETGLDRASAAADPGTAGRPVPRSAAFAPPTGDGRMAQPTAAAERNARPPQHRDSDVELIRRYAPHPYHSSPRRAAPDHDAHPSRDAQAMAAADAMAAALRPALPAGRDTAHVGVAARRAGPATSEPVRRHGAENRHGAEMRRAEPEPTVHVTIGTVEIKAGVRTNPPPRPASRAAPRVGLEEYLRRRRTGDSP